MSTVLCDFVAAFEAHLKGTKSRRKRERERERERASERERRKERQKECRIPLQIIAQHKQAPTDLQIFKHVNTLGQSLCDIFKALNRVVQGIDDVHDSAATAVIDIGQQGIDARQAIAGLGVKCRD